MGIRIGLVLLGCLAASCTSPDALTGNYVNDCVSNGQVTLFRALSNESKEVRVYAFAQYPEGAVLSSALRVTSHWPPDTKLSGVWIDGNQVALEKGANVFFISDKVPARRLHLAPAEAARLPETLKMNRDDLDKFIETVILPHVDDKP